MIEFKQIKIDGKEYIEIEDRLYIIKENPIGVREKFWIVRESGNIFVEPQISTKLLFKYNRNEVSCEDSGEIIASAIAQTIGLKAVEYYGAKFTKDNKTYKGVLCGSYKKSERELEYSGYHLQTMLTSFDFDRETGVANKPINTVYGFLEDLSTLTKKVPNIDIFSKNIKNDLLKQALFDFLLGQTDRHWNNSTFLEYVDDDMHIVRKAMCYDNGCIASLKRKRDALVTISNQIKKDYVNSPRIQELMENYCPMFGIKTSTVVIDTRYYEKYSCPEKIRVYQPKVNKDIFLDELTDEILRDPELALFYHKIKEKLNYNEKTKLVDLDTVFSKLILKGEVLGKEVVEMVRSVFNYQLNVIDQELQRKIKMERDYFEKEGF